MLNIFKHLPGVDKADEVVEPTEADLKAERIQFHREKVRNGPANFRSVTEGQIRRAKARAEKREAKRNFKREVRQHLNAMRFNATVRGQLAVAGVIPTALDYPIKRQVDATVWIVRRFGVSVDRTDGPAYASFKRADVLSALRAAVETYNEATGASYRVPEGFEPAIYEVEDAA